MTNIFNKSFWRWILMCGSAYVLAALFYSAAHASYDLQIHQMNDVTHIEILGVINTDYQLEQGDNSVSITLDSVSSKSQEKLKKYSDSHIQKIIVGKSKSLNKDVVTILLKNKNVQVFDYLTDSPNTLSIDLYKEEGASKKSSVAQKSNNDKIFENKRGPASDEFSKTVLPYVEIIKDGQKIKIEDDEKIDKYLEVVKGILDFDADRLKFKFDSIIESRGNFYLKFPALLNKDDQIDLILTKKVRYIIEDGTDAETRDMKAIQETFLKNDFKNFLRSKAAFVKKHPQSKFVEMLMFMHGEALLELAQKEKDKRLLEEALSIYDATVNKYPQSPLAERTLILLSAARMKNGYYIDAVRNLKHYVETYTKSPLRENMEMYLAHSLLKLQQKDEAMKIFERLQSSQDKDIRVQATYEIGDSFFERKDYKKAIDAYEKAWKLHPEAKNIYPNAYFNKAESEFIEERYKESAEAFRDFITHFPQHSYASYAWTRLGEIYTISDQAKNADGYYRESQFRFKNSNGGAIATMHLLSNEIVKAESRRLPILVKEIRDLEAKVDLPYTKEFLTFLISDAYFNRGQYKEATAELIGFFKEQKIPSYPEKFHRRIGRSISYEIRDHLAKDQVDAGFRVFESYPELWFKKSERIDFVYLKAALFEKATAYKQAIAQYEEYLSKAKKIANLDEIIVIEKLPKTDEVYLRLANAAYSARELKKAQEYAEKIQVANLTTNEQNEAKLLLAKIYGEKGDLAKSMTYLKGLDDNTEAFQQEVTALKNQKKWKDAVAKIDDRLEKGAMSPEAKFELLKQKLGILELHSPDKWKSILARFYDEYKDTKWSFDEEKYKLGQIHLSLGKNKEAEEVFQRIHGESLWSKLANEALRDARWNSQYQKYMDRIPAMSSEKTESK